MSSDGTATLVLRGPVPTGMAFSPAGHLFLADRGAAKLLVVAPDGTTGDVATFTEGDLPRALAFVPVTPETERAGIAGNLLVIAIRRGGWRLNEVLRISGPFDELVKQRITPR